MKHTALTLMILQLNHLLDTGRYDTITFDEVTSHIEDGSILQFLKQRAAGDIDLSYHLESRPGWNFERFYVAYLQSMLNVAGGSKWLVENRGLCLLIALTNEILQQGTGWSPNPNVVDVE